MQEINTQHQGRRQKLGRVVEVRVLLELMITFWENVHLLWVNDPFWGISAHFLGINDHFMGWVIILGSPLCTVSNPPKILAWVRPPTPFLAMP